MINFLKLKNSTKVKFCNINCPFLIMQAKDDDAVKLKSVNYIYNNISSKIKKVKFYKDGGHLILESKTKYEVCLDVDEFLKKVALLNQ